MADVYSLRNYGQMVNDATRTTPFITALEQAIIPGESVVLDIGTSFGFFSFVACQLGAAKVYAVESNKSIEVAKLCSRHSPYADRINWITGLSTEIELPEKVDIIVADLHGTLPFYDSNIASIMDARKRFLKPGGRIMPMRDRIYAVPAQAFEEYEAVDSPWNSNPYGFDFSAGKRFVVNEWWRARADAVGEKSFLSSPRLWGEIDYGDVESQNMDGEMSWIIERDGVLHGLYVWFDGQIAEGAGYSNAPNLPELVYGRAFFPMQEAVAVAIGDTVLVRMSATVVDKETIYRWDTRISDSVGVPKAAFKQSTFKSRPLSVEDLRSVSEDYCSVLSEDGVIAHEVLTAMSEAKSLGQIASMVATRFPDRFDSASSAINHVSYLTRKFGKASNG